MSDDQNILLDLRGLICPEPVLRTKRCFENSAVKKVEALVDDQVNVQNLSRLARSLRAHFSYGAKENHFSVVLERLPDGQAPSSSHDSTHEVTASHRPEGKPAISSELAESKETKVGTVIFISKDTLGEGDREFSNQLLNLFLQSYYEAGHRPRAILMANTGVKLMQPESQFAKVLKDFKDAGCDVLACGLCIDYYGLKEVVPKDQITNMFAICEYLSAADKVLTP
jgi:selenium metabolism protein YedF